MVTADGTTGSAAPVTIADLTKLYGQRRAVDGIDMEIKPGEVFGLIGPDGAGKSTILRCVAGVLSFDRGDLRVLGQKIASERTANRVKHRLGLMPEGLGQNLYGELTVEENINYFGRLRLVANQELEERKNTLLQMTRLESFRSRPMKQLSGGMKQKLGLACTLIHYPDLLLLDEPTTGVDPVSRRDFWSILTSLVAQREMTTIISTAYLEEAVYCDRLALMIGGRALATGTSNDLLSHQRGVKFHIRTEDQIAALDRITQITQHVELAGQDLYVFLSDAEQSARQRLTERLEGVPATVEATMEPDLEDVLVEMMSHREASDQPSTTQRQSADPHDSDSAPAESKSTGRAELIRSQRGWGGGEPNRQEAVEAKHLCRDFGGFRAVDGVNFQVAPGQIFGLLGPNGAGKTTVIKMLTGLLPPTRGNAIVAGVEVARAPLHLKRRIGYMAQTFSLYPDLTVSENIELYAGVYGLSARQSRARRQWVSLLAGLEGLEGQMPKSLPMGMRQRLSLGCALVHQPDVLFLDEPTSGVDPLGRRQFWEIIVRIAREHRVAVLVTTHYMSEAEHCDQLALMNQGEIIAAGSPHQLRQQLEQEMGLPLLIASERPVKALRTLRDNGFSDAALQGRRVRLFSSGTDDDRHQLQQLLADADTHTTSFDRGHITMQDVFVQHVLAQSNPPADDES